MSVGGRDRLDGVGSGRAGIAGPDIVDSSQMSAKRVKRESGTGRSSMQFCESRVWFGSDCIYLAST
jgi:hypothetical protein